MKKFYFNGQQYCINSEITLSNLLNYFDCNSEFFIVQYNNKVYTNSIFFNTIIIQHNDNLQLLTVLGGG